MSMAMPQTIHSLNLTMHMHAASHAWPLDLLQILDRFLDLATIMIS